MGDLFCGADPLVRAGRPRPAFLSKNQALATIDKPAIRRAPTCPNCITTLQIRRSTRRFHSPRGAGFQARNADILVGASGRALILVAPPPLCGAANPGCRRL